MKKLILFTIALLAVSPTVKACNVYGGGVTGAFYAAPIVVQQPATIVQPFTAGYTAPIQQFSQGYSFGQQLNFSGGYGYGGVSAFSTGHVVRQRFIFNGVRGGFAPVVVRQRGLNIRVQTPVVRQRVVIRRGR